MYADDKLCPKLVYQTERNMVAVCQGTKSKNDMIIEAVDQYKDMFVRARANFAKVISVIMNVSCLERCLRLTPIRVFENILKEMVDQMEAEITGRAVLHLGGMGALLVEMAEVAEEGLPLGGMVVPLVETTEVVEEGLHLGGMVVPLVETTEVAGGALR